ncbi:MAG: NmrA family NAD(P)-binding protein [Acidobacteria bacterium]|nr:NmrA family NAD(P)-binding protein [Acidobacteriota bacterium]
MKITVAGATGNIGSAAAQALLEAGHEVRVMVRQPAKVEALVRQGAEAVVGELEDADFVRRATAGADGLFWLTPPQLAVPDVAAWQDQITANAAAAIQANGVARVVHLSALGAQMPQPRGFVHRFAITEKALNLTGATTLNLRPGWFMENLLAQAGSIKDQGKLYVAIGADIPLPLISTVDIGRYAAQALTAAEAASGFVPLIGPDILTGHEIAARLSEVTGRPLEWVAVPPAALGDVFRGLGASEDAIRYFIELFEDFNRPDGPYGAPLPEAVRTPTTLEQFARPSLLPLL